MGSLTLDERFWSRVDRAGEDECWLWTGAKLQNGYGVIAVGPRGETKQIYTHKLAYQLAKGTKVEEQGVIRHSCHTPLCCNPNHLSNGTHAQNVEDKVRAKRHIWGEMVPSHVLKEDDVLEVRKLISSGVSARKIGRMFGVSHTAIRKIKSGETWAWLCRP